MSRMLGMCMVMAVNCIALADSIELSEKNTVTFRGPVTAESVALVQLELFKKAQNGKDLYLVLDTPGGSVDAGLSLIDSINGLPVKVHTITLFAASMGFQIVQNGSDRLITPNGTLMSHRASGGAEGEMPGNLITRINYYLAGLSSMDSVAAKRMGISLKAYQEKIRDEYWVQGSDAVKAKAADKVITARCGADLLDTEVIKVGTIFGPIKLTMSKCPLVSGPLNIELDEIETDDPNVRRQLRSYVDRMFNDKRGFVREYIQTGEWRKFQ